MQLEQWKGPKRSELGVKTNCSIHLHNARDFLRGFRRILAKRVYAVKLSPNVCAPGRVGASDLLVP